MNVTVINHCIESLIAIANNEALVRQFDLHFWGNKVVMHDFDEPEDSDCGFAGCFLGWAAHQRWFQPFGLNLVLYDTKAPAFTPTSHHQISLAVLHEGSEPRFHQFVVDAAAGRQLEKAVWAVAYALGIQSKTLELVIYDDHYDEDKRGPQHVAAYLQQLLALGELEFRQWVLRNDQIREDAAHELEVEEAADA